MSQIAHIKENQFESEVLRAESPVLVDFYTTWCGPCQMLAPVLERLSEAFSGRVKILKVNVEDEQALTMRYGVTAVPTLLLFKGGQVVETMVGFQSEQALSAKLNAVAPA